MKKSDLWILIIGALAIGGFIWALNERNSRKIAENKLKSTENDYLNLLNLYLEKQNDIPSQIKDQLIHLREKYVGIHDDVAIKLKIILELIEENKEEIAIEKLSSVIENLLKEKFIEEGLAKNKKECPRFAEILRKAFDLKWISKQEFNISCFIKDERNEEAHELIVKFPKNWKYISFLAGIEILYNLKGIPR